MLTLAILIGFGLMLLLPCAMALFGGRSEKEEKTAYADRTVDDPARRPSKPSRPVPAQPAPVVEEIPFASETQGWGDLTDPQIHGRGSRSPQNRTERAHLDSMMARAHGMRAAAEALAEIARAATAKATAAAAEATAMESAAAEAILNARRRTASGERGRSASGERAA